MGKNSNIEWTDATHNFWYGCYKVSPGCKHCYMYRDMKRFGKDPMKVTRAKGFDKPLKWKQPMKVFVNSWSDFFIEEATLWRDEAWDIIRKTPHLTYQILTKRPENIQDMLPGDWGDGWDNCWLGVSVEGQEYADERIPHLLQTPAAVRFLSCEPLLSPVDLNSWLIRWPINKETGRIYRPFDWVITGGESGPNYRPANLDWFRQIRDDCQQYSVAYFHKQHGGKNKVGGVWGGRTLDGRTWNEFPDVV